MNEFKLRITEKHLDRAIQAATNPTTEEKNTSIITRCILAQAAKELFPNFYFCGWRSITTEQMYYIPVNNKESDKVSNLTMSFDSKEYSSIRSQLPIEIEFRKGEQHV